MNNEKSKPRQARKVAPKSPGESREAAAAVISTVEIFAVTRFGADAQFSLEERALIEPSLTRLIEQYGGTIDRYSGLLSLIPLVAGVISYGGRLASLAETQGKQKRAQPSEIERVPAQPEAARTNGASPADFTPEGWRDFPPIGIDHV